MEALAALSFLFGLVLFSVLYQTFLEWLLPKFFPDIITSKSKTQAPISACPRCGDAAMKPVFHSPSSNPALRIPTFYLCQHCSARWLKLPGSPFADASDEQYDVYYYKQDLLDLNRARTHRLRYAEHDVDYGPDAPYYLRGKPDNGEEPREVIPNHENWVKCPCCNWRFRLDTASQSGEWPMHKRCGQRLKIAAG